jgi:hypothetical protein
MYPVNPKRKRRPILPAAIALVVLGILAAGVWWLPSLFYRPPQPVTGEVINSYSGQPLAGAAVQVSTGLSMKSGPEGVFSIPDPAGQLTVTVSAPSFEPETQVISGVKTLKVSLRPNTLAGKITNSYTGAPVSGAAVSVAADKSGSPLRAVTDASGNYQIDSVPSDSTLSVEMDGYRAVEEPVGKRTSIDETLQPSRLDIKVVSQDGAPLNGALVAYNGQLLQTGADGSLTIEDAPENVTLAVKYSGYRAAKLELTKTVSTTVTMEPFQARGIYLTGNTAGSSERLDQLLQMIDRTELNSVVIDIKDATGYLLYDSKLPLVNEIGGKNVLIPDLPGLVKTLKQHNIYAIARIVVFEDPVLSEEKPALAVHSKSSGGVWQDFNGLGWTNPLNPEVWDYNISIAKEAASMGFDEIQFDYVRFPSDGNLDDFDFDGQDRPNMEGRRAAIKAFLHRAQEQLAPMGVSLSADIFGLTMWATDNDLGIGQKLEDIAAEVDYVSPMVYPSHFYPGNLGYDNPADHPYEVIYQSLVEGSKMLTGARALVRPWLQDFSLGTEYTPPMVKAQIQASEDFKTSGWLLWNAGNEYTDSVLRPKQ